MTDLPESEYLVCRGAGVAVPLKGGDRLRQTPGAGVPEFVLPEFNSTPATGVHATNPHETEGPPVTTQPPAKLEVSQNPDQDPTSDHQTVVIHSAVIAAAAGSNEAAFNNDLINRVAAAVRLSNDPDEDESGKARRISRTVVASLLAFEPKDEIEGMIAAQAVALHHASLECSRRALVPGQHPDAASKLRKDAANSARGMIEMVEALDRKRGKGRSQVFRVERVNIEAGGQAIVGAVQAGALPTGSEPMKMVESAVSADGAGDEHESEIEGRPRAKAR